MNKMHKSDCQCGGCETPAERMARDAMEQAAFEDEYNANSRAFFGDPIHREHADRVHYGFCYECQVWL